MSQQADIAVAPRNVCFVEKGPGASENLRPYICWMAPRRRSATRYETHCPCRNAQRIVMKTTVLMTAVLLALAWVPASAESRHHKSQPKAAPAAQPQIACTIVGCMPVPHGCHPEMGYTPGGTPTGFDVAVCPNYTLYGYARCPNC